MATQLPAMNLSPEATPWGKAIQSQLADAQTANAALQTELGNIRRIVNSLIVPTDATIADGSVTTPKLANLAVTDAKINDVAYSKITGAPSGTAADTVTPAAYVRNAVGSGFQAMWMNSAYQIMRNTSSERYKENIKPYTFGNVLNLEPVEYDRIGGEHEFGLIAEQVFENVPEIVTWFSDPETDNKPRIDGVRYDLLSVALLQVAKKQAQQIAELQSKVN